jgi:hypothetical protein
VDGRSNLGPQTQNGRQVTLTPAPIRVLGLRC